MLLNLIIALIVGFILLILWILKGIYDVIGSIDKTIKKLAKVTELFHDRLLYVEKLIVDQEEVKKNTTKNE